jgi:hypothetical protein
LTRIADRRETIVEYESAVDAFFHAMPDDAPMPAPMVDAGPARRLRDAMEPISQHSVWSRYVNEALSRVGLDFLTGVVSGRAAALGEPSPAVVVAAFGSFEPGALTALYEQGRRACARDKLLAVRDAASIESLSAVLEDADVGPAVAALQGAVAAVDGTGRPLFSGFRALGYPADPLGRLWRVCEVLREHRGDSHLAAYTAAGVHPLDMHLLSEAWLGMPIGSHATIYGWSAEAVAEAAMRLEALGLLRDGVLTTSGQDLRDGIETRTDRLEQPVVRALGTDFDGIVDALNEWSAACISAAAYPPDPYRRAGG